MRSFNCPKCHFDLKIEKNKKNFLVCKNNKCEINDKKFLIIDGIPILIPFGEEDCILEKKTEKNFVNYGIKKRLKYSKLKSLISLTRKIIIGSNTVTRKNYKYLSEFLNFKKKILIVGGGTVGSGSEEFFLNCKKQSIDVEAIDIYYSNHLTAIADAHYLPFYDKKFDIVIVQAVLEHVISPSKVVAEIYRVLKQDGIVYAETPFMQNVHEGAYDFTRFTHSGHRYLFREFDELKSGFVSGAFSSVLFISSYAISGLFRTYILGKLMRLFLSRIFRVLDSLTSDKFNFDVGCGFYFIGQKKIKYKNKVNSLDLPNYYKGGQ